MSLHVDMITSLPQIEVIEYFNKDSFGSVTHGPLDYTFPARPGGDWQYGTFLIGQLDPEDQDEYRQLCGIPDPKTLIRFFCNVRDAGLHAVYQMTVAALKEWQGDIALLPGGDELTLKRVSGQATLYQDKVNNADASLFKSQEF